MASRSALDIEEMREASRIKETELEFLKGSWNGVVDSSFELNSLMTKLEETKQSQSAWEEAHPKKKAKTRRKGDAKTRKFTFLLPVCSSCHALSKSSFMSITFVYMYVNATNLSHFFICRRRTSRRNAWHAPEKVQ